MHKSKAARMHAYMHNEHINFIRLLYQSLEKCGLPSLPSPRGRKVACVRTTNKTTLLNRSLIIKLSWVHCNPVHKGRVKVKSLVASQVGHLVIILVAEKSVVEVARLVPARDLVGIADVL